MPHVVLLGDSIFDNAPYIGGAPDVVQHLRALLPAGWRATLLAIDGSLTSDVADQLARLPSDTTHLALSIGGNDALERIDLLEAPVATSAEALRMFHAALATFERNHAAVLDACLAQHLPLVVCGIYNGAFPMPEYQQCVTTALALFNDAIVRAAVRRGLPMIDLRAVCCEESDYANPIEPSDSGGAKIARAIAEVIGAMPGMRRSAQVFGG